MFFIPLLPFLLFEAQLVARLPDQVQELRSRPGVLAEGAEHRARDGNGVLFLDAPHRHAQVRRLGHDRDAQGLDLVEQRAGDLIRQPLLHLQAARIDVDQPGDLAEAHDLPIRNVRDVALAEKRQQMVLAEAVEVDVLDDHHLVIIDGEQGVVEHRVHVGTVAARQKAHRLLDPLRRIDESFP